MIDEEFYELFNKCLCEELLLENVPTISQDAIDKIWEKVKPNPWDAVIMYHLLRLKAQPIINQF